jgi:hypothetical protein
MKSWIENTFSHLLPRIRTWPVALAFCSFYQKKIDTLNACMLALSETGSVAFVLVAVISAVAFS